MFIVYLVAMSENIDITIYDFENICRTCLSRENLEALYEKYSRSTCLVDMLMSCTSLKVRVVIFKKLKILKKSLYTYHFVKK